jgi:beta-carotene 3-hydroxylase
MIPAVVFVSAFVAMEAVSYSAHRWVMHGPAMAWHRSHHAPPRGRFERNDVFPVVFSLPAIALFLSAASGLTPSWTWWAAAGVTAYGITYLVVHELAIHRRLDVRVPDARYLRWLRNNHAVHHVDGGEPYGMLLPLLSPSRRRGVAGADRPGPDVLARRASKRETRARL